MGLHMLLETMIEMTAEKWTRELSSDYRDDPVYKKKLEELIDRNKKFEEAREHANKGN